MWLPPPEHPLRRMLSGVTEHAFQTTLGVADPPLTDYLAELLSRFIHIDALYVVKNSQGKPVTEVVDMLHEAAALPPEGRTAREYHRHIGDFTLFWAGLFPEALARLRSKLCKDSFIDYCEQGKRAYYIASTFTAGPDKPEAPVLRRLSEQFELCAFGLTQVRRELEAQQADGQKVAGALRLIA
jgi:hypothetical protein